MRVSDFETLDIIEYGSVFFNYRASSVWSAPEVLSQPKKLPEFCSELDVYSFGMILWELWHEAIPFDNDVQSAV
jgi:serine/threonine protein kinase